MPEFRVAERRHRRRHGGRLEKRREDSLIRHKRYPFTGWAIAGAPDDPGVYALWKNSELIYIGSASPGGATIRSRLVDHFAEHSQDGGYLATEYSWELSRNPRIRELELLEEYRAEHNRLPRLNARNEGQ